MKRKLSDEVTNDNLDGLYERCRSNGAIGGKILGTGGGGFMLLLVKPENRDTMLKALPDFFSVPFSFDTTGSQIIYYQERV
jgi:D-glycero-alpha-D-manno-heptose-7-phosphate kinase